jgi:hypothetical protein
MASPLACSQCRAPLRLTPTCDQGKEMARHKELAALTGLRVYFADPHAPWQRGSNENANGLLRQYLALGHRPVGVLAGRARRDRGPAQWSAAQDARLRDPRRGVRRAGGQGRQRRHVTKCGGCLLRNLNPPSDCLDVAVALGGVGVGRSAERPAFGHPLTHGGECGGKIPEAQRAGRNAPRPWRRDTAAPIPSSSYSAAWAAGEVKRPVVSCARMKSRTLGRICSRQRRPLKMP